MPLCLSRAHIKNQPKVPVRPWKNGDARYSKWGSPKHKKTLGRIITSVTCPSGSLRTLTVTVNYCTSTMTSTLTYILLGTSAQELSVHPVEKWQGVIRSTFMGITFMIPTQNLIGLAPTVHYFTPLTRKPHMQFTGPPCSYLTFCKRENTITKFSYSSVTRNPRFSAPDAAHNSQVHTAAIICVHALLKIGPNRIHIPPTPPPCTLQLPPLCVPH
jgi:hypothetical protein